MPKSSNGLLPSGLHTRSLYAPLLYPTGSTCPARP
jgi:hypothetical protein